MESWIERDFISKDGYQCLVVAHSLGHRCGYVGIDRNHPFYGHDYDGKLGDLEVHGGVTFADTLPEYLIKSDKWWVGFDTAHCGDKLDLSLMPNYLIASIKVEREFGMVRDTEYCADECYRLADQLEELRRLADD